MLGTADLLLLCYLNYRNLSSDGSSAEVLQMAQEEKYMLTGIFPTCLEVPGAFVPLALYLWTEISISLFDHLIAFEAAIKGITAVGDDGIPTSK